MTATAALRVRRASYGRVGGRRSMSGSGVLGRHDPCGVVEAIRLLRNRLGAAAGPDAMGASHFDVSC